MLVRGPFTYEKAETACKRYFQIGFIGLPWLWGLLYIFFRHYQHESETIRWYVQHAGFYSICVFAFSFGLMAIFHLYPPGKWWWVIAPRQNAFQWGIFAANMTARASNGVNNNTSSSSEGGKAPTLFF